MDKRYIVAFLLSLLILLGYPHYLRLVGVTPKEKASYEKVVQEKPRVTVPEPRPSPLPAATIPFKNTVYEILFTNRGARVLALKQGGATLYKADPDGGGIFGVKIFYEGEDLYEEAFQPLAPPEKDSPPEFQYEKPGEFRIVKRYFVGGEKPTIVLEVELENLSKREKNFSLAFQYGLGLDLANHQEEPLTKMVQASQEALHSSKLSNIKKGPVETGEALDWHGLVKKYYAILIKPDWKVVGQATSLKEDVLASELKFTPLSVPPGERLTARILIYAGPQNYEILKSFGFGFERMFSEGWLGLLRVWLLSGLNFFYRLVGNYGAAILVITLLVKLLFTPLTHMSYESMKKMQALQPKVKGIQQQHQKDPARLNKELMELYRRNRVNPMAGCLPLVVQIPIFIAFYQVLAEAVELKGADFVGWIHDLSEPDRLLTLPTTLPFIGNAFNLLPILMIGSMIWQQQLTPQTTTDPMQAKIMYLMPIIFGFVFYNLPSGLVLYWLANNLLTIFHQLVIKRIPVILHHEDL